MTETDKVELVASVAKAAETISQAAAVTAPTIACESPEVVAAVQTKLRALNYSNVGPATGEGGQKTEAGVLDFQNRNGLDLTGKIDKPTLEALQTAAPKVLPAEQVNATAAEIAPKVEAVNTNLWLKLKAKIATWSSLLVALFIGIINNLGDAINALTPLKTFLSEWLDGVDKLTLIMIAAVVVALVSAILWLNSHQADNALVKGYRDGTVGDDNKEAAANGVTP